MKENVAKTMFAPESLAPQRPAPLPIQAFAWIVSVLGTGARVEVRGTLGARSTIMHAVDVIDHAGNVLELAIRRFHDAARLKDDNGYRPSHEALVLEFLASTAVSAPELIAIDATGEHCDVPALLTTRLKGTTVLPPGMPQNFIAELIDALVKIHDLKWSLSIALPAYSSYVDQNEGRNERRPPRWSIYPSLWERVFEIVDSPPPTTFTGFIHRDYHPAQTLFDGSRLTGICDWLTACKGPYGIDLARMRINLAEGWSLELADEFRRTYQSAAGEDRVHPYWDLLDSADVLLGLPDRGPDQVLPGHRRFEQWVERAVAELE